MKDIDIEPDGKAIALVEPVERLSLFLSIQHGDAEADGTKFTYQVAMDGSIIATIGKKRYIVRVEKLLCLMLEAHKRANA